MTTTISTDSGDLPEVHASIAPVDALLDARRTLYQLASDLLRPAADLTGLEPNVLDSPSFRGRIGRALATGPPMLSDEVVPLDAVVADIGWLHSGHRRIPVASRREANVQLCDAVAAVGAELTRQTASVRSLRLLTEADGERFPAALEPIAGGIALARSLSPALADDLLAHVALLGVVDPDSAGTLASASSRSYPGLVLLSPPRSAVEAAEWLVHEAAHQKLFDLAITGSMLTVESDGCPPFEPTWPPVGRQWPLEQTLAAAHAYSCMAQLVDDAGGIAAFDAVESGSLLPVARERATILCEWLLERGGYLGADAHILIAGMCGRRPAAAPAPSGGPAQRHRGTSGSGRMVEPGLVIRRCSRSDRVLVGRRSRPPELFFVTDEAACLLELLAGLPHDDAVTAFARRRGVPESTAAERVGTLVSDMARLGIIHTTAGDGRSAD
jgi:hypothetical protein